MSHELYQNVQQTMKQLTKRVVVHQINDSNNNNKNGRGCFFRPRRLSVHRLYRVNFTYYKKIFLILHYPIVIPTHAISEIQNEQFEKKCLIHFSFVQK